MKKLLIAYGTRPEWIKLQPIVEKLNREEYLLVNTMQQPDLVKDLPSDVSLHHLIIEKNGLDSSLTRMILQSANLFEGITHVMVQGDTSTAFAIALAAFHRKIPILHVEAGMRTFDMWNPYPEEIYRKFITSVASVHFCPTEANETVCLNEGDPEAPVLVVGNTVLDTIDTTGNVYGNLILITLHRRENLEKIGEWLQQIEDYAESLGVDNPFTFVRIAHPNHKIEYNFKHIQTIQPVEREELIELLKKSRLVITDSGGIQEEASFLGKPTIVCRKETERDCSSTFRCYEPGRLKSFIETYINHGIITDPCPFGDGYASERIVDYVHTKL